MYWKVTGKEVEPFFIKANSFDNAIEKARAINPNYDGAQVVEQEKAILLTTEEQVLLGNILSTIIYNGNSVEEKPIITTPDVYKVACKLLNKIK